MKKINLKNISKQTKKKILIGLGISAIVLVLFLSIPSSTYSKMFNFNDNNLIENELPDNRPSRLVYVLNESNELVGINVKVDELNEDEITQKWELLTTKIATYPKGYHSPIASSATLENYEITEDKLVLTVSDEFLNSDGKNALASIAWTFCNKEILEVELKVDDQVINELKEYQFFKIDKSINVNYLFETSYLYEADYVTVIHNENDVVKPVTYFFQDNQKVDYIVSKILPSDIVNNKAYTYTFENNDFVLNLAVDTVLSQDEIDEFRQTVMLNYDIDSLVIANNVMTIYEEVFNQQEVIE